MLRAVEGYRSGSKQEQSGLFLRKYDPPRNLGRLISGGSSSGSIKAKDFLFLLSLLWKIHFSYPL